MSRFGEDTDEQVLVKSIIPPDIGEVRLIPVDEPFFIFNQKHKNAASKLIEIFLGKYN